MKKMIEHVALALGFLVCGGCGQQEAGYDEESRAGSELNQQKGAGILQQDDHSRGHQLSDQNPNLLNADEGRIDQSSYVDQARAVVERSDEFEVDSIWINGQRLWVTVYKKGRMSREERVDAEARLHEKLSEAIPRYKIEVKVQEDRS